MKDIVQVIIASSVTSPAPTKRLKGEWQELSWHLKQKEMHRKETGGAPGLKKEEEQELQESEELWRLAQGSVLLELPFFQSISASAWGKHIPPEPLIYRLLVNRCDTTVKGLLLHPQLQ